MKPSQTAWIVRQAFDGYLMGRLDYGALYIGIIEALMERADETMEQMLSMAAKAQNPMFIQVGKP